MFIYNPKSGKGIQIDKDVYVKYDRKKKRVIVICPETVKLRVVEVPDSYDDMKILETAVKLAPMGASNAITTV
jgi:hypothetical protein